MRVRLSKKATASSLIGPHFDSLPPPNMRRLRSSRGDVEVCAVGTGKMRAGRETARQPHLQDRLACFPQQLACAVQAHFEVVARWQAVQMLLEQPLQLTARNPTSRAMSSVGSGSSKLASISFTASVNLVDRRRCARPKERVAGRPAPHPFDAKLVEQVRCSFRC